MKAIQILMDEDLLSELDRRAKRVGRDRSKLVRDAVGRFLAAEDAKDKERRVIEAYERQPLTREELDWLEASEWPKD
ncbi:MAG: ribbon-helix-helix protein, CopG family [Deltaproteobacteria bacterium]|nr:ribbon-helix-helix protein, CopG family [Deltaproteobacteria bacterium]